MPVKREAFRILESIRQEVFELGGRLFAIPELGFKEHETAAIISDYLKRWGIDHQAGLALTGVKATLGQGGYHIALLADMDALEVQGDEGPLLIHSCGHSIQVTVMLAVLRVLHAMRLTDTLPGSVSLIATPAEEFVDLQFRHGLIGQGLIPYASGKQCMIAQGLFDDIDAVLSCHVSGDPHHRFDVGSRLAGFNAKKIIFEGRSAHSGVEPHRGRNALHAATLCIQASSFLKEQFDPEAGIRLFPILTEGGLSMNAIPERAVLETYLRAAGTDVLFELDRRFCDLARHCAQALDIGCEIEHTIGYLPLRQSEALNRLVYDNMLALCEPDQIKQNPLSGASGDIGDVAHLLPTIQFGFSGIEGTVHSSRFAVADPEHVYMDTVRVLLGTVIDLLEKTENQVRNPHYSEDKQTYLNDWLRRAPQA